MKCMRFVMRMFVAWMAVVSIMIGISIEYLGKPGLAFVVTIIAAFLLVVGGDVSERMDGKEKPKE